MPKLVSQAELDAITDAMVRFPDGAAIEDIGAALSTRVPRRTLQRRLAFLVDRGRLVLRGRGRGSRYFLPPVTGSMTAVEEPDVFQAQGEVYVPVSVAGREIRQYVRRPVQQRKPVGYNRSFLDAYQANVSFYLSSETREHLLKIGRGQGDRQPAGTYAVKILHRLLIDLTWNSSRLEGNTYSLLETERLLALGESAEGKSALETQMILNHKAAIRLLVESAPEIGFNSYTICNLHALLSENLLPDPSACGRLREQPVGIGGSVFHPLEGHLLLEECFRELLLKASAIKDPFEQAFFAMVHLPYLQPFDDVNKRVSRLAANIPLIRENLCPLSFVDVPEKAYIDGLLGIYELNRSELLCDVFVWAYERSCARYSAARQSLGEPDPFRLRYRDHIAQLVNNVVVSGLGSQGAVLLVKQYAVEHVPERERARFIEVVETEIMGLHEGNIARYGIRPSVYANWKQTWQ